jgi:caa(3)-type oxidase subunit IV
MEDRPLIPVRTYVVVYGVLMVLWVVNMAMAYFHLGRYWNNAISVGIGATQFLLVFLFFMHVKYYRYPLIRYFASAGLFWIGILAVLTLADYTTRNRPADASPRGEPVFLQSR